MKLTSFLSVILLIAMMVSSCVTPMRLIAVDTADAPKAIGPYSQAVRVGGLVYTSGQIGLSPKTNKMAGSDITSQTRQAMENLKAILVAAGSGMKHVIKVTVYLKDMDDYDKVNKIYKDYSIISSDPLIL